MTLPATWNVEGEAPAGEEWLTEAERGRAASLATAVRRRDWLLGRAAAKRLLAACESERTGEALGLADVEVLADSTGAPRAFRAPARGGGRLPWELSLSHSGGTAVAVALPAGEGIPGIDLELVEPRAASFVDTFFTEAEAAQAALAGPGRDLFVTATWSAKEAVLKALLVGLTVDTRDVEVFPAAPTAACSSPWRRVDVRGGRQGRPLPLPPGETVTAFWRTLGPFVLALAVRAPSGTRVVPPEALPFTGSIPTPHPGGDGGWVHPPGA